MKNIPININILGIGGSPRRGGNSDTLLDKALQAADAQGAKVEKIILNDLCISACQECGGCDKSGLCVICDDMISLYAKLKQADGIIIASPIFFSGISAQLKTMIDRIQCHWIAKYILEQKIAPPDKIRYGVFICVRGQAGHNIFKAAARPVKAFMATEGFKYLAELFIDNVDFKGAVNKRPQILIDAYNLGQNLVKQLIIKEKTS